MLADSNKASHRQISFIREHESACQHCRAQQASVTEAMTVLRSATIEPPEQDPSFESRIIRQVRVQRRLSSTVSYWMPAIAGAVVTGAALLAILQILFATPVKDSIDMRGREANLGTEVRLDIPNYSEESVVTDPTE